MYNFLGLKFLFFHDDGRIFNQENALADTFQKRPVFNAWGAI